LKLPEGETKASLLAKYELSRGDKGKIMELMTLCGRGTRSSLRDLMSNLRAQPDPKPYSMGDAPTLKDHLEAFKASDKIVSFHQQVPFEWVFEIKTNKPVAIVHTADWQLGEPGVDYEQFETDHNTWLTTPNLLVNIGGDGYQNIIQTSKMGSSHNQQPIVSQRGIYYTAVKPLSDANKLLAIGTGNHNYWSALLSGEDWDMELAHRLGVAYSRHASVIHVKVGKMDYPILRMHKGRFNSSFNLTHSAKQHQRMDFPDARIVVVEHHHCPAVEQYYYNGKLCCAIRPGTYAVNDDFAQQNGFFGARVANPTVVLFPDQDKIVSFLDMYDAINYLKSVS